MVYLRVPIGYMKDLVRLEKERNIRPSPEIDAFMKVVILNPPHSFCLWINCACV